MRGVNEDLRDNPIQRIYATIFAIQHTIIIAVRLFVATVLAELAEQLDFTKLPSSFFVRCKGIVLQRLGYILDEVLGETAVAEALHLRWLDLCKPTRGRLGARSQSPVTMRNARWHIGINAEVEVDDL